MSVGPETTLVAKHWFVYSLRPVLFAMVVGVALTFGQANTSSPAGTRTLWITATEKGHPVPDLKKEDLQLWIGKQEQPISDLTFNLRVPLRVGLLVDMSGSQRARGPGLGVSLAAGFFKELLHPGDQAFILDFSTDVVHVDADLTDDSGVLEAGLAHLAATKPNGGTALYDSIAVVCERREASGPPHRVLIVITDGGDNSSRRTPDEALDLVRGTGTVLYVIATVPKRNGQFRLGGVIEHEQDVLRRMARATGGTAFRASDETEMEPDFDSIAELLRAQYALEFQPAAGKKRERVKIKCTRPSVKILAPEDY